MADTLLQTTIAGSLPKPSWLAEPEKLWAPWRLQGEELKAGKRDATLIWLSGILVSLMISAFLRVRPPVTVFSANKSGNQSPHFK